MMQDYIPDLMSRDMAETPAAGLMPEYAKDWLQGLAVNPNEMMYESLTNQAGGGQPLAQIAERSGAKNFGAFLHRTIHPEEFKALDYFIKKKQPAEFATSIITPTHRPIFQPDLPKPGVIYSVKNPENIKWWGPEDAFSDPTNILDKIRLAYQKQIEKWNAEAENRFQRALQNKPREIFEHFNPEIRGLKGTEEPPLKIRNQWEWEGKTPRTVDEVYNEWREAILPKLTQEGLRSGDIRRALWRAENAKDLSDAMSRYIAARDKALAKWSKKGFRPRAEVVPVNPAAKSPSELSLRDLLSEQKKRLEEIARTDPNMNETRYFELLNEVGYRMDPSEIVGVRVPTSFAPPRKISSKFTLSGVEQEFPEALDFARRHNLPIWQFTPQLTPGDAAQGIADYLEGGAGQWYRRTTPEFPMGLVESTADPLAKYFGRELRR